MTIRRESRRIAQSGAPKPGKKNGYEGKRPLDSVRRVAVIAYHSSPLMEPGSNDAGASPVGSSMSPFAESPTRSAPTIWSISSTVCRASPSIASRASRERSGSW
jgi:hypothetical protein